MGLMDKYKKLPIWGKVGAWGSIASLVSIPLALHLANLPPSTQNIVGNGNTQVSATGPVSITQLAEPDNRAILRANSIRQVSDDLEKIKNLLPPSLVITRCIQAQERRPYFEAYELCSTDSKINNSHAQSLIEKHIANFQAYFSEKESELVLEELAELHRYVYEMHNNSMVYGAWIANSCPDTVTFGGERLLERESRRNGSRPPKCLLTFMRDASVVDRDERQPKYSALSKGKIHKSQVIAIAPGGKDSLKKFFEAFDSELYDEVLNHIEVTKGLLLQLK